MLLNRIQLSAGLRSNGIMPVNSIWLSNYYISIPHKQFIESVGPAVSTYLIRLGLGKNIDKNFWNCTKQVIVALGRTLVLHARSVKVDRAIAVGYLSFDDLADNTPGHAVLVAFVSSIKLAFWDLTTHREYKISEDEKRNCMDSII